MDRRKNQAAPRKSAIVCSPHAVTAAGFRCVIGEAGEYSVVECTDRTELATRVAATKPDLAVIDTSEGIGIALLAELNVVSPETRVVLWTLARAPEFIRQAMDCGVRGVIGKSSSFEACVRCIRQVAAGEVWLDDGLSARMVRSRPVRLTTREAQLVLLLTEGLRNKEIAWRMSITEGTAKAYLTRLYQKTGASDRFELAMFAVRNLGLGEQASGEKPELARQNPGSPEGAATAPGTDRRHSRAPAAAPGIGRGAEFRPTTLGQVKWA